MPSKLQFYAQMADHTARQVTGSFGEWTAFLETAGRLYKYPFHEQLMIFAQKPNATACADVAPHTSTVSIDRNVLLQIYENLVANAVRFSKSEIRIDLTTDTKTVCLCVSDDGHGFSKVAATAVLTQLEHINGYSDYLANIEKSKDNLLGFSIFSSADSFSERNIIKTAKDFKALEGVNLRLDTDNGITAFFNTRLTDYLSVILLAIVCITFLAERKKGVWSLIYATPNGRMKLHGKRVGILFLSSLLVTILLYGSDLLICITVYGGLGDLSRPIQSVVMFGKFTSVLSVGETLLHYLFFRVITLFVVAMLICK